LVLPIKALTANADAALHILVEQFPDEGATWTEWLEATGLPRSTFKDVIRALFGAGKIRKDREGKGARYRLVVPPAQPNDPRSDQEPNLRAPGLGRTENPNSDKASDGTGVGSVGS
jgi:hypothetical protein